MPITTTYPGVYIDEDTSPSIAVTSGPTIPLLAVYSAAPEAVKFNSYLEFLNFFDGSTDEKTAPDILNIKAYFENGGGPCYIANYPILETEAPKYPEINLIVASAHTTYTSIDALCTPGSGRFGILDGPTTEITGGSDPIPNYTANSCTAVYYPFLSRDSTTGNIAPSAVMAGIYCKSDRTRGVWKAPANMPIAANYHPIFPVTDDLQGQYNSGKAINMIRNIDNRGAVVWGARTLEDSDDWRYISVRRLFISAENDIKNAMAPLVFEPNNPLTWEKARGAASNYLYGLWTQGALFGATEKSAYFVNVGEGTTMTADDIAQGKMIIEIGMAAVRPAEFIILQFTQDVAGA